MPLIPFVKNGYYGSRSWIPLVNGNGLTAGGGEPEPPAPVPTYTTVTGIAPLALIGAIQHDIRLLKQFGKCTQASTPTPSAPVDIMCNNGALKWNGTAVVAVGTPETLTVSATGAETQTVTDSPMLLSVGNYADEGEIISGGVTHRIGYHVFDGTETFAKSTAYGQSFLINAASAAWGADRTKEVLCTHFLGLPQVKSSQDDNTCFFNQTGHFYFRVTDNSDTDAFKAWLASEYASGTPVIVFFVLAEETTEQGTPHSLHTTAGDNVVSVVSNVDPVTLEVEYANGYE